MDTQVYFPTSSEIAEPSSNGRLPSVQDALLAAGREYRKAVHHRLKTEQIWAGRVLTGHGALAVIRALKAENTALFHYNRLLAEYHPPAHPEAPRSAPPDNPLTRREHEVLNLLVHGKGTKEIAYVLGMAFKTAACHRYRIMGKLGVHSAAELVRVAIKLGFVNP